MNNIAFFRSEQILPFIHMSSVILFISAQFIVIFLARYCLADTNNIKSTMKGLKRLFLAWFVLIVIIGLSGFLLCSNTTADPMLKAIIATQWAVMAFILVNIFYMIYRLNLARKSLANDEIIMVKENLILICYYFTPLNIVLSFVSVYLGVAISEF